LFKKLQLFVGGFHRQASCIRATEEGQGGIRGNAFSLSLRAARFCACF
jgi:hypothetical protein